MRAKLVHRRFIADKTSEITLDLGEQDFSFKAGQYVYLCLPSLAHPDPRGKCREFSICSSPNEQGMIQTAFRHSESGFKRTLLGMPLGSAVDIDGPFGLFTIPKRRAAPVVLIAGGIGVTPFMSMIRVATEDKHSLRMLLITSNTSIERAAFREELRLLAQRNPHVTFRENIGHLTPEFIRSSVGDAAHPTYYLAGSPKMVHDIREALKGAGIDDDDILVEEFVGYA